MSRQLGSDRPDPVMSDVDADYRLASEPTQKRSQSLQSHLRLRRLWPFGPTLAPCLPGSRLALSAISAALLMVSLLLPGPGQAPAFAGGIPSADSDGNGVRQPAITRPVATMWSGQASPQAQISTPATNSDLPPSLFEPLPAWVQSLRATRLWPRAAGPDVKPVSVPPRTRLRVLDRAQDGWLPVALDGGSSGQLLDAWVRLVDVLPSDQQRVLASSRGGARPGLDVSAADKFIAAVAEAAQESQRDSGVPCSVTIAQAILESDWGKSQLSTRANNFFGIKATKGPGPAGAIKMDTWEVLSGRDVVVNDAFRAYHNLLESVMDHGRYLADNPRYAPAFKFVNDAQEFARQIQKAGYATDPAYSTKLINLMNKFDLYQFDLKP